MQLTLGDVLDQPEFGLQLRTGGDRARLVPVEGAHSIDLRDPVRWLQENWIMLTTGVQLRGSASAQRALVAQLSEGRIAALGFGVGIAMRRVPTALLHEAERRDFPVFTVLLETPFRQIISYVNRSALSDDLYVLRRLTSMQRYLLDAMHQPAPDEVLVERLASLLGGAEVAYLDGAGKRIAATAPVLEWRETALGHATTSVREFEHHGRWGVIAPVSEGDAPAGWLAVLLASASVSRQVARPVVRTASELLGLVSVTRLAATHGRRARRGGLGARVLRLVAGESDGGLSAALAVEGIDFTRPCRVVVLTATGDMRELRERLEMTLETGGVDLVAGAEGNDVIVLAQDDLLELGEWLQSEPALADVRAGVSAPLLRLEDVATAIDEARLARSVAIADPRGAAVQRHDALEPSVALLAPRSAEALRTRLVETLAPLEREPRLRAAVVAYLDAGLDVGRAAHTLGLHRNSIRYRLDRAERLLGRSLRSPGAIATLHLALVAERLDAAGRAPAARTTPRR
jgi:purine catabolism regulator